VVSCINLSSLLLDSGIGSRRGFLGLLESLLDLGDLGLLEIFGVQWIDFSSLVDSLMWLLRSFIG